MFPLSTCGAGGRRRKKRKKRAMDNASRLLLDKVTCDYVLASLFFKILYMQEDIAEAQLRWLSRASRLFEPSRQRGKEKRKMTCRNASAKRKKKHNCRLEASKEKNSHWFFLSLCPPFFFLKIHVMCRRTTRCSRGRGKRRWDSRRKTQEEQQRQRRQREQPCRCRRRRNGRRSRRQISTAPPVLLRRRASFPPVVFSRRDRLLERALWL